MMLLIKETFNLILTLVWILSQKQSVLTTSSKEKEEQYECFVNVLCPKQESIVLSETSM